MTTDERLSIAFNIVVNAALNGERCPENSAFKPQNSIPLLCRQGRLKVYISSQNFRQVEILDGPYAGKMTAPDPAGRMPWKIIGTTTWMHGREADRGANQRQQPSKPKDYSGT